MDTKDLTVISDLWLRGDFHKSAVIIFHHMIMSLETVFFYYCPLLCF